MNRILYTLKCCTFLFCTFCCSHYVTAQTRWINPLHEGSQYVHGRGWTSELGHAYQRLPERAKKQVRAKVWHLSQQDAGLSIVFQSNAPDIQIRYQVSGRLNMPHMPSTGVSGVDLYAYDLRRQVRWAAAQYAFGDTVTYHYKNLVYADEYSEMGYEYHLYLPLYNHVDWLEIGVPEDCKFQLLPVSKEKPLVVYGTSIAQGACASRPGMSWTNIVQRELDSPLINLGFSGNGCLEPELFRLMAEIDARMYLIDCMPNMNNTNLPYIYDRVLKGVSILRKANNAPIVLVEHSGYLNEFTSKVSAQSYKKTNMELRKAYNTLIEQGVKDIYYLTKEAQGLTIDAMVEGVHPSDLGMRYYANGYIQKIKAIEN